MNLGFFEIYLMVLGSQFYCGLAGYVIGLNYDEPNRGFAYGFYLGPIGWIVICLVPRKAKESHAKGARQITCPRCGTVFYSTSSPVKCPECSLEQA